MLSADSCQDVVNTQALAQEPAVVSLLVPAAPSLVLHRMPCYDTITGPVCSCMRYFLTVKDEG